MECRECVLLNSERNEDFRDTNNEMRSITRKLRSEMSASRIVGKVHNELWPNDLGMETLSLRLSRTVNICVRVSFSSNSSAVHELWRWQHFHGRRYDLDLWPHDLEKLIISSSKCNKCSRKFRFKSVQRFRIYRVHKMSMIVAAWPWHLTSWSWQFQFFPGLLPRSI